MSSFNRKDDSRRSWLMEANFSTSLHETYPWRLHPVGKPAVTHYRVMEHFPLPLPAYVCVPRNRSNSQIRRVHMKSHIHHPLVVINCMVGQTASFEKGAGEEFRETLRPALTDKHYMPQCYAFIILLPELIRISMHRCLMIWWNLFAY